MEIISEKAADGVTETRFNLAAEGETVPGKRWGPEGVAGGRPTVLMGHGGFQSKEAPNIVEMAAALALQRGFVTYALDAPGHGERRTEEQIRQQEETLRRLQRGGAGDRSSRSGASRPAPATEAAPEGEVRLPRMVREWRTLLDELDKQDTPPSSYGYWGVSMGARNGIPLAATDSRIKAAVFGLFAYLPDPAFRQQVKSIEIPLLFLFQYDDELMTPEAGLALWKNFGSKEKTMHINPGPHVGIPLFERDAASAFFARHLD
jgi:dienelactone hydrolase